MFCIAAQVLDKLLEQTDSKQEMFAKLAMANLHAYSAPSDRRKEDSAKKAEVHYSHALELYRRVLEKDEGVPGYSQRRTRDGFLEGKGAVTATVKTISLGGGGLVVWLTSHLILTLSSLVRSCHAQAAFLLPMEWAAS